MAVLTLPGIAGMIDYKVMSVGWPTLLIFETLLKRNYAKGKGQSHGNSQMGLKCTFFLYWMPTLQRV